jgi:hypothetical protein
MKNDVNVKELDVMSAEELIKGVLELEALKEIMDGFSMLKSLENTEPVSVRSSYPANRPIAFNKANIEVDPVMKMRREFNAMLHKAIVAENYEEAARLRDLMKAVA